MITLDQQIEVPFDGTFVDYSIAHFHENGYAGLEMSFSWDQSSTGQLTYFCYWDDLHKFVLAIMGDTAVIDDFIANASSSDVTPVSRYSRIPPHKLPIPGDFHLWATKITRIVGIPGQAYEENTSGEQELIIFPKYTDGRKLRYRYAAVTVQYEPVTYPILSDYETPYDKEWMRYTSIQKTPRLDFLNVAMGTLYWVDSPPVEKKSALPHNIPLREQSVDYIVTFHRLPEAFFNPADYVGYVNSYDQFLAGHPQAPALGFKSETMLLLGVQEVIKPIGWADDNFYDYIYFFQFRPNTHNKARRRDSTPTPWSYTQFSLNGLNPTSNTYKVFKTVDMSLLFLPN